MEYSHELKPEEKDAVKARWAQENIEM